MLDESLIEVVLTNTTIDGYFKRILLVAKPHPFSTKFRLLFFVGKYEDSAGICDDCFSILFLLVVCFAPGNGAGFRHHVMRYAKKSCLSQHH